MKYQRFTLLGCKVIGIERLEIVAKTQIPFKICWYFFDIIGEGGFGIISKERKKFLMKNV